MPLSFALLVVAREAHQNKWLCSGYRKQCLKVIAAQPTGISSVQAQPLSSSMGNIQENFQWNLLLLFKLCNQSWLHKPMQVYTEERPIVLNEATPWKEGIGLQPNMIVSNNPCPDPTHVKITSNFSSSHSQQIKPFLYAGVIHHFPFLIQLSVSGSQLSATQTLGNGCIFQGLEEAAHPSGSEDHFFLQW